MVKLVKDPKFDHERAAFFMPSGNGPCRFGQYHRFHRLVLDDLGFRHVPVYSPNQDETLYTDLGIMGSRFTRLAWQGIVAVDLLMKKMLETRPYEKEKGQIGSGLSGILREASAKPFLRETIWRKPCETASMNSIRSRWKSPGSKPLIGIVGEIFVRLNRLQQRGCDSKDRTVRGEAWIAPLTEWILYVNTISKGRSLQKKSFSNLLKVFLTDYYQKKDEHRLEKIFKETPQTLR